MLEEDLRQEAVRRRLAGESADVIAESLGRSARWVRKWTARHGEVDTDEWNQSRSRAPHSSPTKTSDELAGLILDARARLVANPRAQRGSLAIQWELHRLGVVDVPPARTIEHVLARAGVTRRRGRQAGYASKHVPYPAPVVVRPGELHQIDMVGPRQLLGSEPFHALNLIDVGSHLVGNEIITELRPPLLAKALVGIWDRVGVPTIAQFDNHANFRGGIQPNWQYFGPIVATCLDLGVVPRFIPLREPWRNGVIEHFNDVWDKSFFRTETFANIDHLRVENTAFIKFHNEHHRYTAHDGATPQQMWHGRQTTRLRVGYQPPAELPSRGRIEVVRFIRSNQILDLFGKRITIPDEHSHRYVTAIIRIRSRHLTVVTLDGEIIHQGDFKLSRTLR